ncbi:hypothetical protein [Bifidobacterium sp.]|uniref:hypothetical protein n=1 Tax=Bifidobacterium sp. TaxID=41200 RepID=UPI0039EC3B5D
MGTTAVQQANGPWDWNLSTTLVVVGWAITLAITITGWVITSRRAKKTALAEAKKAAEDNALARQRHQEQIDMMKERLQTAHNSSTALKEQVKQLTEANRLYSKANPENKAPWGDAEWTGSGDLFRIHLSGTRPVVVTQVKASEDRLSGLFDLRHPTALPCSMEPGDSVEYLAFGTNAGTPETLIEWNWENSTEPRKTTRSNVKPNF